MKADIITAPETTMSQGVVLAQDTTAETATDAAAGGDAAASAADAAAAAPYDGLLTGTFSDWTGNIADMTAIYPFVGSEVLLVILGLIFWVFWHWRQMRMENSNYTDDLETLKRNGNMDRALRGERILRPM